MASNIIEFFGYAPTDVSREAQQARAERRCPFIREICQKTLSDGSPSGACTLKPKTSGPVICCPYRLYADDYQVLSDVAEVAFGTKVQLIPGHLARSQMTVSTAVRVAVFGKRWGKELRLPNRGRTGGYFVDWVLVKLSDSGELQEFVAVEVQSIDTTGNYQKERRAYLSGDPFLGSSSAGFKDVLNNSDS